MPSCQPPRGYIARAGDCDDTNADVHPYATEDHCGLSIDFNCDGHVGPIDVDGDGWFACEGDCDENDTTVNKGGVELCDDNVDNDCNGQVDGGDSSDAVTYYPDGDGDGYGSPLLGVSSCDEPAAAVATWANEHQGALGRVDPLDDVGEAASRALHHPG